MTDITTYGGDTVKLQNNGLNESTFKLDDELYTLRAEALLGLLPYMLHPEPRSAFVVGFGGGHTARILSLTDIGRVKIVELEPAIVRAGRSMGSMVDDVLDNPKVELEYNDARNALLVDPATYDFIASQPSHPWLSGAAGLFTQEFWEIARARLNAGGIFSQWVNLFSMNTATLKSLLAAFYGAFNHGFVVTDLETGDMILIGSNGKIEFDYDRINSVLSSHNISKIMRRVNIELFEDIIANYNFSRSIAVGISSDAEPSSDTNIISEVNLASSINNLSKENDTYHFIAQNSRLYISQFISHKLVSRLKGIGEYFLYWEKPDRADEVAALLRQHDPFLADSISYRALLMQGRHKDAVSMFAPQTEWNADIITENIQTVEHSVQPN